MKNALLLLLFFCFVGNIQSQEDDVLRSKKGHAILPQAGDLALGFDAVPLLDLALNAIKIQGNTGQTAEHPGYAAGMPQIIVGKYFLSDKTALRARFGINTLKTTDKIYGDDPLNPSNPFPDEVLLSKSSFSESRHFISLGMEHRRGYNRLHGIYGGEVLVGKSGEKITNKYEIEFNDMAQDSGFINVGSARLLTSKNTGTFIFGVRGFVGVEYFVAPKISIGAEFGWSVGVSTESRTSDEIEFWGIPPGETGTTPVSYTRTFEGEGSSSELGVLVDTGISSLLGSSAAVTIHFLF